MDKDNKISVKFEIPLNRKTANICKMLEIQSLNHIDGKALTNEQCKTIEKFLNKYFNELIEPIKTFDGIVFQKDNKMITFCGNAYIQVIQTNNNNGWCWESIDFNGYSIISEIEDKGIIEALHEKLRDMINEHGWAIINYYYFCLKHGLEPQWGCYHHTEAFLKEKLEERIKDDIDAMANIYYQEGYENDYLSGKFDSEIHKESYMYDLLDQAREEYENSDEQKSDIEQATSDVTNEWLSYSSDSITKQVIHKILGLTLEETIQICKEDMATAILEQHESIALNIKLDTVKLLMAIDFQELGEDAELIVVDAIINGKCPFEGRQNPTFNSITTPHWKGEMKQYYTTDKTIDEVWNMVIKDLKEALK